MDRVGYADHFGVKFIKFGGKIRMANLLCLRTVLHTFCILLTNVSMNRVWLSFAWSILGIIYILLSSETVEAFPNPTEEEANRNEKNCYGESDWKPPSFYAQINK